MNADADIAHHIWVRYRINAISNSDQPIIEKMLPLPLKSLIKEFPRSEERTKKRSENDNEEDALSSAPRKWMDASHKRTGWRLHFANFSRREVARPRSLIFLSPFFSPPLASRHSCSPSYFFPFDSWKSRANTFVVLASARNFLGSVRVCDCKRVRVLLSFTVES